MTVSYSLSIDLDRDGFFNAGVSTTDALNLIPRPVRWNAIGYKGFPGATIAARDEETAYGLKVLRVTNTSSTTDSLEFGIDAGAVVDDIPVSASTQYTAVCWVKGVSAYSGVGVKLIVSDQSYSVLGVASAVTLTGDWQRLALTFSTGVGDTFAYIRIEKDSNAALAVYDATGFMLVAGGDGPTVFNAGATSNALDTLTTYAMDVQWQYGLEGAFTHRGRPAEFGVPAQMRVQLVNRDDAFLPETVNAAYFGLIRRGQLVRLQATDATGTTTLFVGRLKEFTINPSQTAGQVAELLVGDITLELLDAEFRLPLQVGVTTGTALGEVFRRGLVPWPYAKNFWLAGVPGSSEAGVSTIAYEDTLMAFDTGRTTLAYVGDNLDNGNGISAQGFLRDVLGSEAGGRLFYDAARTKYVFQDRAHDVLNDDAVSAFTLDDFIDGGADYRYGDNLINALTVNYQQRTAGTPGSVLWRYSGVLRLPILGSTTLSVRFTDPAAPGVQTSASAVLPLAAGVDFNAFDNEDLTGDRNSRVSTTFTLQGNGGTLTITNSDDDDDIYISGLQVRGTPLNAFTMDQRYYQDGVSIAAYERVEPAPYDLRVVDDPLFALQVARFIVNRFKEPMARFDRVTLEANQSATLLSHAMRRRIGDKISITSSRIGHDSEYVIIGQQHNVIASEGSWRCTWLLMPYTRTTYWRAGIVGASEAGVTTRPIL